MKIPEEEDTAGLDLVFEVRAFVEGLACVVQCYLYYPQHVMCHETVEVGQTVLPGQLWVP